MYMYTCIDFFFGILGLSLNSMKAFARLGQESFKAYSLRYTLHVFINLLYKYFFLIIVYSGLAFFSI